MARQECGWAARRDCRHGRTARLRTGGEAGLRERGEAGLRLRAWLRADGAAFGGRRGCGQTVRAAAGGRRGCGHMARQESGYGREDGEGIGKAGVPQRDQAGGGRKGGGRKEKGWMRADCGTAATRPGGSRQQDRAGSRSSFLYLGASTSSTG